MKSRKNIFIIGLVFAGTLLTSKTHSRPIFLNSNNDSLLSGEKNLREVKVDTSFSSPAFFESDAKKCDQCLSRHDDQHPQISSLFPSGIKFDTLELRLQSGDSISKIIHGINCQQQQEKIVKSDFKQVSKTIGDLLQNSNCDFNVETIKDRNVLEVSAEKKNKENFIRSKNREIELIAKTIWGEGRGESYEGKVAIGNVIVNRYKVAQASRKSHWWGNTIEQIILHPYQFSCHNYNDPNKRKIAKLTTKDYQYRESLKIAKGILSGAIKDNTFGATHYFAYKTVQPRWALKMNKTKRIGNHDFYKK